MACPESLNVQALADGELDAAASAAAERHLEGCAECRAQFAGDQRLGAALRTRATRHRAPAALAARLGAALDAEDVAPPAAAPRRGAWPRLPGYWPGAASGALAAGVAALVLSVGLGRGAPDPLAHDVVAAHLRALVSGRAIDVETSDRHTVKPWFAGKVDVAPPVADFAAQGFALAGGRVDFVDGVRAAVVVYRHGAHVIDVFAWRDAGRPVRARAATESGYSLLTWRSGDLAFCAVSDTAPAELATLERLLTAEAPAAATE
jgi:anti-sigma factor RsiW